MSYEKYSFKVHGIIFVMVVFTAPDDPLNVTITPSTSPVAGSPFTLTCVVTERVPGLLQQPTATWLNNDGDIIRNGSRTNVATSKNSFSAIAILTFPSLRTSQSFQYTCRGTIYSLNSSHVTNGYHTVAVRCESLGFHMQVNLPVCIVTYFSGSSSYSHSRTGIIWKN